jgi:hypothetical protein
MHPYNTAVSHQLQDADCQAVLNAVNSYLLSKYVEIFTHPHSV